MKKLFSLALTLSILGTAFTGAIGADTKLQTASALRLTSLGLIDYTDQSDLSATVSRAEFIHLVIGFFNKEGAVEANPSVSPFLDVPVGDELCGEAKYMFDNGVLLGEENRMLYPKRDITLGEASIILVKMLGLKDIADKKGAGVAAYISVMSDYEVLRGLSLAASDALTLGDVYVLLDNALLVNPNREYTYNSDGVSYSEVDDKTTIEKLYDVKVYDGYVTSNCYTSLTSPEGYSKGQIGIDGVVYESTGDFNDYLGMYVRYYVKNDDTVVYVEAKDNKNSWVEFKAEDVTGVEDITIDYEENDTNKKKHVRLEDDVDVIYNGKVYLGYGTIDNIIPEYGTLRTLDNDSNGRADVVFVTAYENFFVKGINSQDREIHDYYTNKSISLKADDNIVEFYTIDGEKAKFSSIKDYSVVSVTVSANDGEKLIRAYISTDKINGKIDGLDDEYAYVNGSPKSLAPSFGDVLEISDNGDFYLDIFGYIAGFKSVAVNDYLYAYVYGSYRLADEDNELKLRTYTASGVFMDMLAKDRVIINGIKYDLTSEGKTNIALGEIGSKRVIRYKQNEEGFVTNIETALSQDSDKVGFKALECPGNATLRRNIFGGSLIMSTSTIVFNIPDDTESYSDYAIKTNKSFSDGSNYTIKEAYYIGDTDLPIATVMVVTGMGSKSISDSASFNIILGKGSASSDGEVYRTLKLGVGGATQEYMVDNDLDISVLKQGDVIQIATDKMGIICDYSVVYSADNSIQAARLRPNDDIYAVRRGQSDKTYTTSADFSSYILLAYAEVKTIENPFIQYKCGKNEVIGDFSSASVSIYNKDKNTLDVGSTTNIIKDDVILIRSRYAAVQEIIIIR